MPLWLCLDERGISFLGLLISFLGTVGMLMRGLDYFIRIEEENGKWVINSIIILTPKKLKEIYPYINTAWAFADWVFNTAIRRIA